MAIRKYGAGLRLSNGVLSVDLTDVVPGAVPTTRQVSTSGPGLTGGGNLGSDRTIALAFDNTDPNALGTAATGTSGYPAHHDHTHPTTGLALLAGADFTGAVTCNNGFQAGVSGSVKLRVKNDALLLGNDVAVDPGNVAVVLPNNATYAMVASDNVTARALMHLSSSDQLIIGDELGDIYLTAGTGSMLGLLIGGSVKVNATTDNLELSISSSGFLKILSNSTEKFRFGNDGGLLVGSSVVGNALTTVGVGLQNNAPIKHRLSSSWVQSLNLDSSGILSVGATGNSQLDLICGSSGTGTKSVRTFRGATQLAELDDGGETSEQTALQLQMNITGTPNFYRVKVATTIETIPTGAYLLYVIP